MHLQKKKVSEVQQGMLEHNLTPLMSITGLSSEVSCTLRETACETMLVGAAHKQVPKKNDDARQGENGIS